MPEPLPDVRVALEDLTSDQLELLFATPQLRPATSPALVSWVEHAADWEMNRRKGFNFRLEAPDEAIDPCEDPVAIKAAIELHHEFAGETAIARFFASAIDVLIGRGQRR